MQDNLPVDPLTETTYLILLSLAADAKHGYAIIQEVAQLSNNRVELSTGTLYGAINRMLENEWIERTNNPDKTARGKKIYRLTEKGHSVLDAEVNRMKHMIRLADMYRAED